MNENIPIKPVGLLGGLTYTYPIAGVIRAGTTVQRRKGERTILLPNKLDEFILTLKHKDDAGEWVRHPLDAALREKFGVPDANGVKKLRRLPVTLAFDRTELSLTEQYAAFSNEGRPVCVGNGVDAKRRVMTEDGPLVDVCRCPGADNCDFGIQNRCDTFLRLLVRIEGQSEMDGLFILRTGSINGVTDTRSFVEHLRHLLGGRIADVPLWLDLEPKQSALSRQSVFWHATFRGRFASIVQAAKTLNDQRAEEVAVGIDRAAAERVLLDLRGNGAFADQAAEDGVQFEDLIAARFMDEADAGEQHRIEVKARRAAGASPSQAAATAVAQLSTILGAHAAAPAAVASAATDEREPATAA